MSIVRVAVVLLCSLQLACPSKPPTGGGKPVVDNKGAGAGSSSAKPDAGPGDSTVADPDGRGPLVSADGIACVQPGCVYHVGADAYHACLTGGEGTCFHYGPTCTPAGKCMFDKQSGSYRACQQVDEGRCLSYGAGCEPEGKCYFNPADLRHHACDKLAGGKCVAYGELCVSP